MRFVVFALLLAGCSDRALGLPTGDGGTADLSRTADLASPHQHCGGFAGMPCPTREFCDFPSGLCGFGDEIGVCVPQPKDCVAPPGPEVCGCDGQTYPSDCERAAAGVPLKHSGPC